MEFFHYLVSFHCEWKEGKKQGTDELMTALTNQQDATAAMLTSSCEK